MIDKIIILRPTKSKTMKEAAAEIAGDAGRTMAGYVSARDQIAFIFPEATARPIDAKDALESLQAVFKRYNVGSGAGTYNLSGWSTRVAFDRPRKVLKIGVGRKIAENKRGNTRSVTFKTKVIPALESLGFIAGASIRAFHDKDKDKTISLMVFPIIGTII